MPTYNVHLYREMRLFFPGIEADTPEEAAKMVAEYPSDKAESYEDCEGVTLAPLVDLVGAKEYRHSKTIDLDPVKAAAQDLYDACAEFVRKVEAGEAKSTRSYQQMKAALAKARDETLPESA